MVLILSSIVLIVLLFSSALISGAEVAFFSLKPNELEELSKDNSKKNNTILRLVNQPKELLATILISNNFINISIIVLSTFLLEFYKNSLNIPVQYKLFVEVILITFVILLFGEVIPKVYATKNGLKLSKLMAFPLNFISNFFLFKPIVVGLVFGTSFISNLGKKKSIKVSTNDLEQALELTKEGKVDDDEHKILEGIVKFGSTDVKQIMKPRTDIIAFEISLNFDVLVQKIVECGFSRIPIYKENIDKIEGILFTKDLIPFIDKQNGFDWNHLIRQPYFVPETKKIDDLLKSFQEKKMHMAVVVDEFGGTSGIVTLEDIIEEIVGEITDEFDNEELSYSKLNDQTYIFEGKIALIDFYKILEIDGKEFEDAKGESDTLAGFLIEQAGKILLKNEKLNFNHYTFVVESSDKRKITKIKTIILNQNEN